LDFEADGMSSEDEGLAVDPFSVGAVGLDSKEFASSERVVAGEEARDEDFGSLPEDMVGEAGFVGADE
jgi:hypothetical protein